MGRSREQKRREFAEAYGGKAPPPEPPKVRQSAIGAAFDALADPHKKRREAIHGWLAANDFVQAPDYDTLIGRGDWVHKSGACAVSAALVQDCVEGHLSWRDTQGGIMEALSAPR